MAMSEHHDGDVLYSDDLLERAALAGFELVTRTTDTGQRVWEWHRGFEPRPQFVTERVARYWMLKWLEATDAPHTQSPLSRPTRMGAPMPTKSANVKNKKQYEALKDKGMSKQRAAKIANSPQASKHGGKKSGSGGDSRQGGTTAQHKAACRRGGRATARKSR